MSTTPQEALAPGSVSAWRLASRLRTLPVAAAPVVVGCACAWRDGAFSAAAAGAALFAALCLQVGANLANDAFDHQRGADGPGRLGPPRAAQLGLLSSRTLLGGTTVAFALAALAGLYLAFVAGWPIIALGILGMVAAVTYVGPGAYGYHGGGELAVFLFFGVAAVVGSYYVQALSVPPWVVAASWPFACLASAVLVVNNVRDLEEDRASNKRTLSVRLGAYAAPVEYAAFVVASFLLLPVLAWYLDSIFILLPVLLIPEAWRLIRGVRTESGAALNPILAGTARLELLFAFALSVGLVL